MVSTGGQVLNLLPTATLAAAATAYGPTSAGLPIDPNASSVTLEIFFVRAGGGTSCDVYLQTSFDAGATWVDIAHNAFLTTTASRVFTVFAGGALPVTTAPTDATLTADTKLDGLLGDYLRVKYVTVGTYSGASSLTVRAFVKTGTGGQANTDASGRTVIRQTSTTATVTSVNDQATNVTLLAANTARVGASVYNDSTSILYLKLGATATTSSYTSQLPANAYYEVPFGYTGIIDGLWSADSTGAARITELT